MLHTMGLMVNTFLCFSLKHHQHAELRGCQVRITQGRGLTPSELAKTFNRKHLYRKLVLRHYFTCGKSIYKWLHGF